MAKKQENIEGKSKLQEALDKLEKTYGKGTVINLDNKVVGDYDVISTGSIGFDWITLGIGGFAKGKMYELMGWESVGKSTICAHATAECQKNGGKVLYIDGEHAVDVNYFKSLGVDVSKLLISQPSCIWEEEFILTPNGNCKFKDLVETNNIVSIDHMSACDDKYSTNLLSSNKEGILLRTGRFHLIASAEHRIKTYSGYKPLESLEKGKDCVEYLYKHDLFSSENKTELNKNKAFLLGAFLGDGNYNRSSPRFCGIDEKLNNYILELVSLEFPDTIGKIDGKTTSFKKLNKNKRRERCSLQIFLNKYLGSVSKQNKYVPKEIFNSGRENLKSFIAGLIVTDGSISKVKHTITFENYIKEVILDVSSILSFFAVPHSIHTKTKNTISGKRTWYSIAINNKEGLEFFKKEIPLVSYKNDILQTFNSESKRSFIRFPKELWKIIFEEIKLKYKSITEFSNLFFDINENNHHFNIKRGISNEYLIKINSLLKSKRLEMIINSDVAYCNILEKTNLNEYFPMKDMTVPITNNFICNGLVVHNCGEEGFQIAVDMVNSGEIDLCIIDSDSSLIPKAAIIDGDVGDSTIGKKARLNSNAYPRLKNALVTNKTCVIVISQYREKIGVMFGNPTTTQGGHALKYYSDCRIEMSRSTAIKEGDQVYGNLTKVKAVKNKMASPFRIAQFEIIYGKGINKVGEILELLNDLEIGRKYGKCITIDDLKYDLDEYKTMLVENNDFYLEMSGKIIDKLKNIEPVVIEEI